ncbi:hypothetical protein WJX82_004804 [Trebouxia sp. C0006]
MSERAHLAPDAIKDISQRLSGDLSLRLPTSLQHNLDEPITPQRRKEYVTTLLERDPGVFLERYANKLLEQERAQFEPLRDDYEVDFYLKLAEDEAASAAAGMSATAKNRRLAQLNRLIEEGKYFSEDAMPGDDKEYVDYAAIDKNATLDDDWAAQAQDDAQEKYFDAD